MQRSIDVSSLHDEASDIEAVLFFVKEKTAATTKQIFDPKREAETPLPTSRTVFRTVVRKNIAQKTAGETHQLAKDRVYECSKAF